MNIFDIKHSNRKKIYFYMREHKRATRQQISFDLHLSVPTVTQNLEYLAQNKLLISEISVDGRGSGRNPTTYTYIPDAKISIGVDITRHHLKLIAIDLDGNVIKYIYRRCLYERTEDYLMLLGNEVDHLIALAGIDPKRILGVSIAVPGLVNSHRGVVIDGRVIDNTGMTHKDFGKYIRYPSRLIHDSDASGFSEIWNSPNIHNAFYISLCNSVGGSVFIDDGVYEGDGLFSGEIGHLMLHPDGLQCYCGQKGCMDPYCNAELLSNLTDGELHLFFERLAQGDNALAEVWETYMNNLASSIISIRMLFGCPVIIGGYVGAFIKPYMQRLWQKIDQKSPFGEKSEYYVFPCKNKTESVATGAALYYIQDFLNEAIVLDEARNSKTSVH